MAIPYINMSSYPALPAGTYDLAIQLLEKTDTKTEVSSEIDEQKRLMRSVSKLRVWESSSLESSWVDIKFLGEKLTAQWTMSNQIQRLINRQLDKCSVSSLIFQMSRKNLLPHLSFAYFEI